MNQLKHPTIKEIAMTDVLYALADPLRLEIVRQLYTSSDALTCTQLNQGQPKSSMSYHYRILREAGVIRTHVAGRERFNLLRKSELDQLFPGLLSGVMAQSK